MPRGMGGGQLGAGGLHSYVAPGLAAAKMTRRQPRARMPPDKGLQLAAPMDKSVEHILLRLLTLAVLLFFAAHLAAGVLDVRPEREQSAGRGYSAHYLEAGSGAARVKRPSKVQLRRPGLCEEQRGCEVPSFVEAAATSVAVLVAADARDDLPAHASRGDDILPSPFIHARTRNPRDPPALI